VSVNPVYDEIKTVFSYIIISLGLHLQLQHGRTKVPVVAERSALFVSCMC